MARTFSNPAYVTVAHNAAITFGSTQAFTLSFWVRSLPANGDIAHKATSASLNGYNLYTAASEVYFELRGNTGTRIVTKLASLPSGTRHLCYTYSGSQTFAGVTMYLDGTAQTLTNVANNLDGNLGTNTAAFEIGRNFAVANFAGDQAEWGMWNADLSAAEAAALSRGVSPLLMRPGSLQLYLPLWGDLSPEPDFSPNRFSGTLTNTTKARHVNVAPFTQQLWTPTLPQFDVAAFQAAWAAGSSRLMGGGIMGG